MPAVVLDPMPDELVRLTERRRALGQDRHDEMWEGVLHMAPAPMRRHARLQAQVLVLLEPPARAAGLEAVAEFNLGDGKDDFRVPDGGLLTPGPDELYLPTAALVLEIVSPGDETWEKLPFYAAHGVDELLIVDPATHKIDWLALSAGEGEGEGEAHGEGPAAGEGGEPTSGSYRPIEHSNLIELSIGDLAKQIDWPGGG